MEGHAFAMRLTDNEFRLVADLSAKNVKPHDILSTLKEQNPENVSTLQTIYNAKTKIRKNEHEGMTQMQGLLSSLKKGGYIYYYRTNNLSNELEDLFFIHPRSLEIWQAFPQVMLMDATYKTNKYKMPLLEVVGVTSTRLTFCIAFVFTQEEKEFNYTWALNCLKSTMGGSLCPRVIVTDRELALMKACHIVFPNSKQLLFLSQTEEAYNLNPTQLQTILFEYSGVRDYLHDVWLHKYKHMFIAAWTDKILHYGNNISNRVESQHAKLKLYLDTPQSNLWKCSSVVHNIVQSQVTAIKASFEYSKGRINHRVNMKMFELLWNYISLEALDMISNEFERCKSGDFLEKTYFASPINMGDDDDIHCDDEVKIITENFEKQPRSIKHNILRNLREFINPSKTSVPSVHKTTRGRPSLKKKPLKDNGVDAPIEDPHRHSCSNTYELGLSSTNIHEPPRHSSYANQQNYSYSYMNEFRKVLHPYIKQVHNVEGDGHCGFRAIASCLGLHQDEWYQIRVNLMEEL
ncbi:hypothetical protein Lser_V15G40093 [Lactuca serriola]